MRSELRILFALAGTLLLAGCDTSEQEAKSFEPDVGVAQEPIIEEAGNLAFVTRASVAVIGRPPRDAPEREQLVTELGAGVGALIDRLTADEYEEELVRHWSSVLLDMFRVYRLPEGTRTNAACWNTRVVTDPVAQADLGRHVASHPTSDPWPGGAFTMRDVIEGALRADDLRGPLRANLFAQMVTALNGNQVTEPNKRADLWTRFETTYLNRQLLCLGCHNNEFSVSGNVSDWDRHAPLPEPGMTSTWRRRASSRSTGSPNRCPSRARSTRTTTARWPWSRTKPATTSRSPTRQPSCF